ncbi:MAG: two-component regulator propeller domain-containing protein, partial [Candidatus Parabeggiatoa sp.]|nr:two-component regulator propeller domain-containing protein [Candidatus Parabeggiatoa sp.]
MSIYIYRKMKLFWLIICLLASFQLRAEITFTSAEQVVEKEGKIALSVSGTVGALTWTAQKGWIEGNSTMVIYTAPPQAGWDGVMVMDAEGNVATLKIQIKASVENANWQVFTNRDSVNALALSKDKATLWVGSEGGLEKRDATTGESKRFFLSSNGFPSNEIQAIVNDNKGGLWVGTADGLAHVDADGKVKQTFTTKNSYLPNDLIKSLLADGKGGVWIGTQYGTVDDLAHLDADGNWDIFKEDDSGLKNYAYCLLSDDKNGIWMGNHRGLIHFDGKKGWTVFNTENSQLPDNTVLSLESDGNNGLWVGTEEGLAHFHPESNTWSNVDHSKLPSHEISAIQYDGKGGIWLGTDKGLVQFQAGTIGQIYSVDNSELPSNQITAIESDGNGGLWLGTSKGIAHLKSDENSLTLLGTKHFGDKSNLPSNDIQVLSSSQAGIWVGTDNGWASWDKADKKFESFHSEDFSTVFAIESDNAEGVWLGTEKGVFHRFNKFNDDNQALFNTKDSDLRVYSFLDAGEEIWAGTNFGLFKLAADNLQGRILEGIPDIHVKAIQPDDKGGIWVGLGRVVLHIKADNTKTPFNFELQINADTTRQFHFKNSDMPNKWIRSLHADGDGGVWVGLGGDATFRPEGVEDPGNCLVHIRAEGDLKVIERDDSGPQLCRILSIQKDGKQGIWVGFGSGGKNVNGKFFG